MSNFDRQPARLSFSPAVMIILLITAILVSMGCSATETSPVSHESPAEATGIASDVQTAVAATQLAPPTPTPTRLPSPTVTATPTASEPVLEITEDSPISNDDALGQINVTYPLRMSPGSSDGTIIVTIHVPDVLVSIEPMSIEIITIPPDAPPIVGARGSDEAIIRITNMVRVELIAPAFQIGSAASVTRPVNIETLGEPTYWNWTLVAPDTIGSHNFTLNVYLADEVNPTWTRVYQIEVADPNSRSGSFFLTTVGAAAIIGAGSTIIVGLISFFVARHSFPVIGTKASYRRTLKMLYANLARLEGRKAHYGLDVPTSLENEIEMTKERIAEIEARLEALEVSEAEG